MRVIIAGSRGIDNYELLDYVIAESGFNITEVISGMCKKSPDMLGVTWANANGIPVIEMPANWNLYGKSAGYKRNVAMAENGAEALIALWDGVSAGTKHMIDIAKSKGLKTYVYNLLEQQAIDDSQDSADGEEVDHDFGYDFDGT